IAFTASQHHSNHPATARALNNAPAATSSTPAKNHQRPGPIENTTADAEAAPAKKGRICCLFMTSIMGLAYWSWEWYRGFILPPAYTLVPRGFRFQIRPRDLRDSQALAGGNNKTTPVSRITQPIPRSTFPPDTEIRQWPDFGLVTGPLRD